MNKSVAHLASHQFFPFFLSCKTDTQCLLRQKGRRMTHCNSFTRQYTTYCLTYVTARK